MAYHIIRELTQTIQQSPMRAALAAVLLITTTVYVCTGHDGYRVAEIGEVSPSEEVIDLTENADWINQIEQVAADAEDVPAVATRVGDRDQYIDARLTHAVAVEDEEATTDRTRVTPVSAEEKSHSTGDAPVWLLGTLGDD